MYLRLMGLTHFNKEKQMAITRTIECDICPAMEVEKVANEGWAGWGALNGVAIDGKANPTLCPTCLSKVAAFTDAMKQGE